MPDTFLGITCITDMTLIYWCNTTMSCNRRLRGMPRNLVKPCHRKACTMTSEAKLATLILHYFSSWGRKLRQLNVNHTNKTCRKPTHRAQQRASNPPSSLPNCWIPPRHVTTGQPLRFCGTSDAKDVNLQLASMLKTLKSMLDGHFRAVWH